MPRIRVTVEYNLDLPQRHCLDGAGCHEHGCPYLRSTCPHHHQDEILEAEGLAAEIRAWNEFIEDHLENEGAKLKLELLTTVRV